LTDPRVATYSNCARNPKRAVRILNPSGGAGWTSVKQAIRFVEQGRARYVDEVSIEMIEDDYRHISAGRIEPPPRPHSPAPLDVSYVYKGPANLRTFAYYPDPLLAFVY
jgi:hypothetical protein